MNIDLKYKFWNETININVPVVYMAQYMMMLMRANPVQELSEGVGSENPDFCGPWHSNKQSGCHLSPKKSRFSGPTPFPMARVMDLTPSQSLNLSPISQGPPLPMALVMDLPPSRGGGAVPKCIYFVPLTPHPTSGTKCIDFKRSPQVHLYAVLCTLNNFKKSTTVGKVHKKRFCYINIITVLGLGWG